MFQFVEWFVCLTVKKISQKVVDAHEFLSRVSILLLTRDIDIVILSVRLSVRDTLVLYENG